jgi:hypothetical protein
MALCLAATAAQAEPAADAVLRPAAAAQSRVEKFTPATAPIPPKIAEPQRWPLTAVALTFTDDADSVRLPAFATPSTPVPTRFVRIGIQWSF